MHSGNQTEEDEFEEVGYPEDLITDKCEGFQLIPQSKSIMFPAKKGYFQAFTDGVKVKVTNLYYKLQQSSTLIQDLTIGPNNCYFLGTRIKSRKELAERHKNLIYFTYRDFDQPICHKSEKLYNDTCTLV